MAQGAQGRLHTRIDRRGASHHEFKAEKVYPPRTRPRHRACGSIGRSAGQNHAQDRVGCAKQIPLGHRAARARAGMGNDHEGTGDGHVLRRRLAWRRKGRHPEIPLRPSGTESAARRHDIHDDRPARARALGLDLHALAPIPDPEPERTRPRTQHLRRQTPRRIPQVGIRAPDLDERRLAFVLHEG